MQYMSEIINEFIIRDHVACGIEYAPAENAGIKLARHDIKWAKEHQREVFVQGKGDDVYLTSGCMLPLVRQIFMNKLRMLQSFKDMQHQDLSYIIFLEDKIEPEVLATYLKNLFNKPINYITLTPTITACQTCGQKIIAKDAKDIEICPVCGSSDIASFSRVIGYVRMIARQNIHVNKEGFYEGDFNFWSKARRLDWAERRRFKEDDAK